MTTTQDADQDILKIISDTEGTQVSSVEQTKPDDVVRVFFGNFQQSVPVSKRKQAKEKDQTFAGASKEV